MPNPDEQDNHPNNQPQKSVRIDKWLWAVRLYKTRSMAMQACRAGHVKIQGKNIKPSRTVQIGDRIQARTGQIQRTVEVLQPIEQRVGAKEVPTFMNDLTPPELLQPPKQEMAVQNPIILYKKGAGRPTKRDRRRIDALEWT